MLYILYFMYVYFPVTRINTWTKFKNLKTFCNLKITKCFFGYKAVVIYTFLVHNWLKTQILIIFKHWKSRVLFGHLPLSEIDRAF